MEQRSAALRAGFPNERFDYSAGIRAALNGTCVDGALALMGEFIRSGGIDRTAQSLLADVVAAKLAQPARPDAEAVGEAEAAASVEAALAGVGDAGAAFSDKVDRLATVAREGNFSHEFAERYRTACVHRGDLEAAIVLWTVGWLRLGPDHGYQANLSCRLFSAFHGDARAFLFIDWLFHIRGEEHWSIEATRALIYLFDRHELAAEFRAAVHPAYRRLDPSSLPDYSQAVFGCYFGDRLSSARYRKLISELLAISANQSGPTYTLAFLFSCCGLNSQAYDAERTAIIIQALSVHVEAWLESGLDSEQRQREAFVLLVIADAVDPDTFARLVRRLWSVLRERAGTAADDVRSPLCSVRRVVRNFATPAPAVLCRFAPPGLCVEISGRCAATRRRSGAGRISWGMPTRSASSSIPGGTSAAGCRGSLRMPTDASAERS